MGGAPAGSLGTRVGGPGGMVGGPVMIGPAPMSGPVLGPMSGPVCAPVGMPGAMAGTGSPFGYDGTDSWGAVAGGLWSIGAPPPTKSCEHSWGAVAGGLWPIGAPPPTKSCEQQAWEEQLKVQPPLRPRHRGLSFGPGDKVQTGKSDPLTGRPMFRCNGMGGQCRECRPLTESGAWAKHNLTQEELTAQGLGAKRYCGECKIPICGSRGDASRADAGGA